MNSEMMRTLEDVKIGMQVYTPRFCTVTIDAVFLTREEASKCGYTEETYYGKDAGRFLPLEEQSDLRILGKMIGENRMSFCACMDYKWIIEKRQQAREAL